MDKLVTADSSVIVQFEYPSGKRHIVALLRSDDNTMQLVDPPLDRYTVPDRYLSYLFGRSEGILVLSAVRPAKLIVSRRSGLRLMWVLLAGLSLAVLVATSRGITISKR